MTQRASLYEILNHETGDSWNGTHGHHIGVTFDSASHRLTVRSTNDMNAEFMEATFTADEVKAQIFMAARARYFREFRDLMNRDHPEIVESLKTASVCIVSIPCDKDGRRYYRAAGKINGLGWVEVVLDPGLVNYQSAGHLGSGLLHHAACMREPDIAKSLLAAGANPNIKDSFGASPLHLATAHGYFLTAQVLLAAGANINERNNAGQTPLDVARWAVKFMDPDDGDTAPVIGWLLEAEAQKRNLENTLRNVARLGPGPSRRRLAN